MHTTQQQHVRLERRLGVAVAIRRCVGSCRVLARARTRNEKCELSYLLKHTSQKCEQQIGGGEGGEK